MARVSVTSNQGDADAVAAQLARAREVAAAYSDGAERATNPESHEGGNMNKAGGGGNSNSLEAYEDARGHFAAGGSSKLCGVGLKVKVRGPNVEIVEIVHGTLACPASPPCLVIYFLVQQALTVFAVTCADSPAWRSQLAVGDSIVAVDGHSVSGCVGRTCGRHGTRGHAGTRHRTFRCLGTGAIQCLSPVRPPV